MLRLTALAILLSLACSSQIDSQKLDSLSHVIALKNKSIKAWQDSFNQKQDSIYRQGISNETNRENPEVRNRKEKPRKWIALVSSVVVLLGLLITVLFKRTKKKK